MKIFKVLHPLVIGCWAIVFLIGVQIFFFAGNWLLGMLSLAGVATCFYFGLVVLTPAETLPGIRFLFDKATSENLPLKSYEELMVENVFLTSELENASQSFHNLNILARQLSEDCEKQRQAAQILELIKFAPVREVSNN